MRSHRLRIPGRHAYDEHRAHIGLPEHGRSILARRVIRRHPLCVIAWSACGVEPTISGAQREFVRTSRRRCGLHAVAKTVSRVAASGRRASPVGLILVDHCRVVIAEHFVVAEALDPVDVGERRALVVSELCLLAGEDLDFAGRRIYVPRMRKDRGRLVRVRGIKTEAAERVIPMLPAVYDLLLEHKAEFDFGTHDPVFANRNGQRNAVDNVRRTIVETAVERANDLLVLAASARSRTARRTLCDAPTPRSSRRSTCLPGARCTCSGTPTRRSRCAFISRSSTLARAASDARTGHRLHHRGGVHTASGRGVLAPNRHPSEKKASQLGGRTELEGAETA
jgi:hypothetical protein